MAQVNMELLLRAVHGELWDNVNGICVRCTVCAIFPMYAHVRCDVHSSIRTTVAGTDCVSRPAIRPKHMHFGATVSEVGS